MKLCDFDNCDKGAERSIYLWVSCRVCNVTSILNHQARRNTRHALRREWYTVCPDKNIVHQVTPFPIRLN